MIKVVSWNVAKRHDPWRELVQMADNGDADIALLQEAGSPPEDLAGRIDGVNGAAWNHRSFDRWPLVVKLSDRVTLEPYRQVAPISDLGEDTIGASDIGTVAAARVIPHGNKDEAFVAVSMYARWLSPHPSTNRSSWIYSDASAHRIISDLSTFIGHSDPAKHKILAAGDLNMFYGSTGWRLSLPDRDRTVWDRMQALGLEFLGPQAPHGRQAESDPDDVPPDTKNVPTYYRRGGPEAAVNQLDYVFASRGFHEKIAVRAMNEIDEWGPSDHCRLLIDVKCEGES
ncbi:MAG: hypothetical protein OXH83_00380 [Bryobacterales bacterium]|nr:hypothetical protein [Bryobacterales bacterium]